MHATQRRGRRRFAQVLVAIAAVALFGAWQVWQSSRPLLDQPIPPKVLPSPNALDFYLRAAALEVDSDVISAPTRFSPAQLAAAVERNRPALAELRRGFANPYADPSVRSFRSPEPLLAKLRALARLLAAEATVRANRGDWASSVSSSLDGIRLGLDMPRQGAMEPDLRGIACEAVARRHAWVTVDHLSATEARAAALRMNALLARQVTLREVWTEAKWFALGEGLELLDHRGWATELLKGLWYDSSTPKLYAEPLLRGRRAVLRDLAAAFDEGIERVGLPYPQQAFSHPSQSELVGLLVPDQQPWACKHTTAEAQNALLTVSLALRAWRLEHAACPERLAELVPSHLPALPPDPFAVSGPLGYRREGDRYVLWSIGPDGRDNQGQPVLDPTQKDTRKWLVEPDSLGDVVAGVNR